MTTVLSRSASGKIWDTIIVGAGSAGCVLANRLSADPSRSVLLLEAGGSDAHPFVRMPAALSLPMNSQRFNWFFESEPEPALDNRRLHCPRGKVLGGSSSINGMVYVRGHALDFERWQSLGATGWGYADVLPYFKRAERTGDVPAGSRYRGLDGPLAVTRGRKDNPLHPAFLAACSQAGYPAPDDLNGYQQEGFGDLEMTIDDGVRCSTARAYLAPVRHRSNLGVRSRVLVERVTVSGKRADGVVIRTRGGPAEHITAGNVILAAGAIGSPHLLLLSGIGPAEDLSGHSIGVASNLPGVGQNLMDHLEVYLQQTCTQPISLNRFLNPVSKALIGARWLATRGGLGATNHFETGGFIRSMDTVSHPDIQFHFLPAAVSYDGRQKAAADGFQVHVGPMASPSRGDLRLRSADPRQKPTLRFNYMSDPSDWRVFRSAIRQARAIINQPALAAFRGPELAPGPAVKTNHEIDAFVRANAESAYHPCGTCRMGTAADAVVDPSGRVYGIEGLRVIDSSVFPHITNGNLNAPTIMLAEKLSDDLLGQKLPAEDMPFFV